MRRREYLKFTRVWIYLNIKQCNPPLSIWKRMYQINKIQWNMEIYIKKREKTMTTNGHANLKSVTDERERVYTCRKNQRNWLSFQGIYFALSYQDNISGKGYNDFIQGYFYLPRRICRSVISRIMFVWGFGKCL